MIGKPRHQYRSIFISDTHLGSRGCKSEFLLDFLENHDCQQLYLVGDIFDSWRLKKRWFWDANYDAIIQNVLSRGQAGAKVFYLSGNHDGFTRNFTGHSISQIELAEECIHVTADGRRMLVLHGDKFDGVVQFPAWLTKIGDWVESCTAMVEDWSGALHLVHWADSKAVMASEQESYVGQEGLPVSG